MEIIIKNTAINLICAVHSSFSAKPLIHSMYFEAFQLPSKLEGIGGSETTNEKREFNGLTLKVKTEICKRQRNGEVRDKDESREEEEGERGTENKFNEVII